MLVGIPLEQSNSAIKPKECAVEISDVEAKMQTIHSDIQDKDK